MGEKRSWQAWASVLLAGTVGIAVFHWYQIHELLTKGEVFLLFGDELDARFVTYLLEHLYQWLHGEVSFRSPLMFYPVQGTLGYSDILLALEFPYALVRGLGLSPLSSMTIAIILSNFLVYLSMAVVLWKGFKARLFPSLCGALFFAFNSAKGNQLNHLQLQPLFLLPPLLWVLYSVVHEAKTASSLRIATLLCLGATLFHLQLLTAYYPAWYFFFFSALFVLVAMVAQPLREALKSIIVRHKKALGIALVLVVLEGIPFYQVYGPVLREMGWRPFEEVEGMVPRPLSFLWMGEGNPWWAWLKDALPIYSLHFHWEHRIGVGVLASSIALFLMGAGTVRLFSRTVQKESTLIIFAFLAASLLFLILGISFQEFTLWNYVYEYIPGARGIRAVCRYVLILLLPVTVGAVVLFSSLKKRTSLNCVLFFLFLLIMIEQGGVKKEGFYRGTNEKRLSEIALQLDPTRCRIFYLKAPSHTERWFMTYNTDALLVSAMTKIPTLNGYSGQEPKDWGLGNVTHPEYEKKVQEWIEKNHLENVCSVTSPD